MNTSKEYIEMCEKAVEVQALRDDYEKWEVGDYSTTENIVKHRPEMPYTVLGEQEDAPYDVCNPIWLPSQNQLQEMVGIKTFQDFYDSKLFAMFYGATIQCHGFSGDYITGDYTGGIIGRKWSMEQFWLAFVMKEKYNKVWTGEEWVNA